MSRGVLYPCKTPKHVGVYFCTLICVTYFPAAFKTKLAPSFLIVSSFWWCYTIIIVATYGANLIAFLSIDTYAAPFQTLEQLANMPEYKLGTIGGTSWMDEMKVRNKKSHHGFRGLLRRLRSGLVRCTLCLHTSRSSSVPVMLTHTLAALVYV